jgi:ABC-2 type transport system ATP-binding protein
VNELDPSVLALLLPLVALQMGLLIWALLDLVRPERRVRGGSKAVWALVIALVSLIGPLVYFLAGRDDSPFEPPPAEPPGPGAIPGWATPVAAAPGPTPTSPPGAASAPAAGPVRRIAPDAPPAIVIEGLTKRYGGSAGVLALDDLRLAVPAGSVFGLLGPNGAGKTTALRLLVGLTRPTAGSATVDGLRTPGDMLEIRRRLGYLEQNPRGYGWMTGREQLELVGRLHSMGDRALADAVATALRRVGLEDAAGRRVDTYSGGMRQRLGIAGALVHRPAVVILDEPVSALDPEGRRDVLQLIHELRGESTVLFSTHVLADVERICDRVGILARGRLVVEGALADLLDRYALPVYRLEAEPGQAAALEALASRLRGLEWVTEAVVEHGLLTIAVADPERAARELLAVVAAADLAVVSFARARPTLEDVFLRLTSAGREAAA